MKTTTIRDIFIDGAISPNFIADAIAKHQSKTGIGAHQIFLGQVRADTVDGKTVGAIEYTAYKEMANEKAHRIKEDAITSFNLSCLHIYHSHGLVKTGEICFFVFASSPHREAVNKALPSVVDAIKAEVPIFGKEILEDHTSSWKVNR